MIVSFVSGKGGVGKTSLAVNLAWVSAQSRKTVIVDLDIQNRGLSGLLERFTNEASKGAFEVLGGSEDLDLKALLIEISPNLFFLPAASSRIDPSAIDVAALLANPEVDGRIKRFIANLKRCSCFELLILDCHGGLDYLSLGAHRAGDKTIMVTEADTVNFNGSLELLSFYQSIPEREELLAARQRAPEDRLVQTIVNRIPPKYRFDDLNRTYANIARKLGPEYKLSPKVLAFLPQEDFLASSFGEYPFCAELAPNSVFSKKLWLVDFILSRGDIRLGKSKISRKIMSQNFRVRVERCLTANEAMNTQRMLSAFCALSIAFAMYLICIFPLVLFPIGLDTIGSNLAPHPVAAVVFVCMVFVVLITTTYYLCRAMLGAFMFYRDRYSFKLGLWTALGRRLRFGERLVLGRLLILRATFGFSLLFYGFSLAALAIGTPAAYILLRDEQGRKPAASSAIEKLSPIPLSIPTK